MKERGFTTLILQLIALVLNRIALKGVSPPIFRLEMLLMWFFVLATLTGVYLVIKKNRYGWPVLSVLFAMMLLNGLYLFVSGIAPVLSLFYVLVAFLGFNMAVKNINRHRKIRAVQRIEPAEMIVPEIVKESEVKRKKVVNVRAKGKKEVKKKVSKKAKAKGKKISKVKKSKKKAKSKKSSKKKAKTKKSAKKKK